MRLEHVLVFGAVAVVTWYLVLRFWPRMLLGIYRRALLTRGFGDGPVPVNTLYTERPEVFADPLHPPSGGSRLMSVGVNRDTLATVGWLDLAAGPQVLQVPEMAGRYYSVQLTDPSTNTTFAYVGKRTTGTGPGEYVITGPGWTGQLPAEARQIVSPHRQVLLLGRVLVRDDADLPAAHALARRIRLTPWAHA